MDRLRPVSVHDLPDLDLRLIHQVSVDENRNGNLLPRSLETLQSAYRSGQAVALANGSNEALGFIEISMLLGDQLKSNLGLDGAFPSIAEIGGAVIVPEQRGFGYYPELRRQMLHTVLPDLQAERLLLIGTTKNIRVLHTLADAEKLGITFYPSSHREFPMIQPFTCVCKPEFGSGVQFGEYCPARVDDTLRPLSQNLDRLPVVNQKIPCIMYVSSQELAMRMNQELVMQFGSPIELLSGTKQRTAKESLISSLRGLKYYE